MMILRTAAILTLSVLLTACHSIPYRIDVDQGNLIDQKALSQISIGMSKNQVQQVLGSPLLTDMFHQDRWDYIQYYQQGQTQTVEKSKVSLYFVNDLLSRIDKDQFNEIEPAPLPYSITSE